MVQSKILYVGFSTGTANILCVKDLLKAEIFPHLTFVRYSLETLSLLNEPKYNILSSLKYL